VASASRRRKPNLEQYDREDGGSGVQWTCESVPAR
jgi:hypothetical protein